MKTMNEQDIDRLLHETFEREERLEEINRRVMHSLKRAERQSRLRAWVRIAGIALGLPLALVTYMAVASGFMEFAGTSKLTVISMVLPGLAMLGAVAKIIATFSLPDV